MANEYFINGVQKYTNPTNANYMTIGSDTIDANGTVINPKYLSAMVSNTVNPTNLNLVNAMSVASATTSPAYTINLQSAPAGVGSLWGIDYETTTVEDFQFKTSNATSGVNFNTVGGTTSSRIKNGTITSTSSANVNTITPNQLEITDTGNVLKKSTFGIIQWLIRNGATAFTQFDPTEINITSGNDTARLSTTTIGTNNTTTGLASSIGSGVGTFTSGSMGTRITNAGINLGYNTTTLNSSITMTTTNVTNGVLTKTWTDILTAGGGVDTLTQVLTAGNTAPDLSAILTSGSTTLRNTLSNTGLTIGDTALPQKYSRFAINTWDLKQDTSTYLQVIPSSWDMYSGNDSGRMTSSGTSFYNGTTTRSSQLSLNNMYVALGGVGININNSTIDLGYNTTSPFAKALSISSTNIVRTTPSTTKTWDSLLTIGTLLQATMTSASITSTRLCQASLNSGAVLPAGTYMVSYMVVFPSATTTYTTGFATPAGTAVDNSTASGTLYQYGGTLVNNTGTTGATNVSASGVIVFDGTKSCAIGISVAPTMTITTAYLQAVRIA